MRRVVIGLVLGLAFCVAPAKADSASDYMQGCTGADTGILEGNCERLQKSWPKDFKAAYRGSYDAQRNVAFCLTGQCGEAVRAEPMLACAWRIVIMKSGDPGVGDGDIANFNTDCGRLTDDQRGVAEAQAATMYRRIYKRSLK